MNPAEADVRTLPKQEELDGGKSAKKEKTASATFDYIEVNEDSTERAPYHEFGPLCLRHL